MKKRIPACFCVVFLLLSGCKMEYLSSSSQPENTSRAPAVSAVEDPVDSMPEVPEKQLLSKEYGRGCLALELQNDYDLLVNAMMAGKETVRLSFMDRDTLVRLLTYVRRDHPEISWVDERFTFQLNQQKDRCTVQLSYTKTLPEIHEELTQIEDAAQGFLANISPELSDFDKAVLVFDRLCQYVEYDLSGPRQSDLAGALLDGRAGCGGYAKAYQYLLTRLGVEALIVYGTANVAHAWNIVRLDGNYYLADPTWGDAKLEDGTEYTSHSWLFLDDAAFEETHTPYLDGTNYPLPECDSYIQNYFVKTETLVSAPGQPERAAALTNAFNQAAANGYTVAQIAFDEGIFPAPYLEDDSLDRPARRIAARKGMKIYGRSQERSGQVISYFIEPKEQEAP